jgi:hypothetical protein
VRGWLLGMHPNPAYLILNLLLLLLLLLALSSCVINSCARGSCESAHQKEGSAWFGVP